eukprot:444316-Prorocentrum_minimum.AAC.2
MHIQRRPRGALLLDDSILTIALARSSHAVDGRVVHIQWPGGALLLDNFHRLGVQLRAAGH